MIGYLIRPKFLFIKRKNFYFFRTKFGIIINLNKSGTTENDIIKAEAINNNRWIAGQIESDALKSRYQPILLKPSESKLTKLKNLILSYYSKIRKGSNK